MILQALAQYYEDLAKKGKIARPGWAKTKISYALCINENGELEQVVPLLEAAEGKKPQPQQFDLPAPVGRSSTKTVSNFLWDHSGYLLGVDAKRNPERSVKCFDASKQIHHLLLDDVDSLAAKSILAFFDAWDPSKAREHPALRSDFDAITAGGNLLLRVNGLFANEDEQIRQAWQTHYDRSEGKRQQCLITGNEDVIEPTHQKIKGVDGALSNGAAIVSFNAPAFCSYGQEQNYNAPSGSMLPLPIPQLSTTCWRIVKTSRKSEIPPSSAGRRVQSRSIRHSHLPRCSASSRPISAKTICETR